MKAFGTLDSKSCFSNGGLFLKSSGRGRLAFLRADCDCQALRDAMHFPEKALSSALIAKDSRSTKAGTAELPGLGRVFIKKYNNRGLRYTLRYLFRRCRAFKSWQAAWLLEQLQVPVPKHFAAIACRSKACILGESYLISQALDSAIPTLDLVKSLLADPKSLESFLSQTFSHLARMHQAGISHGDLKFSNLAARSGEAGETRFAGFLDLDATRFHSRPLAPFARLRELARIASSFIEISGRTGAEPNVARTTELFLKKYVEAGGHPVDLVGLNWAVLEHLAKRNGFPR